MPSPVADPAFSILSAEVTGVILAGGMSERMGTDKALLMLEARPFIGIITDIFRSVLHSVLISSNDAGKYADFGVPVVPDSYKDCGPLGGIYSALQFSHASYVFVTMCDAPFISPELVRFVRVSSSRHEITVARDNDIVHPLFGIYPSSVLPRIERYLDRGGRRVMDFLDEEGCRLVDVAAWKDQLRNINNPEDYEKIVMKTSES